MGHKQSGSCEFNILIWAVVLLFAQPIERAMVEDQRDRQSIAFRVLLWPVGTPGSFWFLTCFAPAVIICLPPLSFPYVSQWRWSATAPSAQLRKSDSPTHRLPNRPPQQTTTSLT